MSADFLDRIFSKSCASMAEIPDGAVDCVVTSPPFETQRVYSLDRENHGNFFGDEFIEILRQPLSEIYRVLKPEGSAFINFVPSSRGGFLSPTLHRFPALLEEVGFKVAQVAYVVKTNARPTSDPRLLKNAVEPIYHVVKTADYYANKDAIRRPSMWAGKDPRAWKYNPQGAAPPNWLCPALEQLQRLSLQEFLSAVIGSETDALPMRKTQDQASIHAGKMADEVAEWLILYGSKEGDVVCDPWLGSATSACRAKALGRHWTGYEIVPEFAELARGRIEAVAFGEALGAATPAASMPKARPKPPSPQAPAVVMKCRTCGAEFKPKRRKQVSCSSRCRYTHWNRVYTRVREEENDGTQADSSGGRVDGSA